MEKAIPVGHGTSKLGSLKREIRTKIYLIDPGYPYVM
jgi:hypothetical protein